MGSTSAMTTPESSVDSLMQQVADEHGLRVADEIQAAPSSTPAIDMLGYSVDSSLISCDDAMACESAYPNCLISR